MLWLQSYTPSPFLKKNLIKLSSLIQQNISTCWICNGYYAPNFGEPLCGTCHAFLFSVEPQVGMEEQSVVPSDDEDSGNDEPPYSVNDRQDRDELEAELPEEVSENEQEENEFELEPRPEPAPPMNVNHFIDLLSNPHDNSKSDNNIDALPVEGLYFFGVLLLQ